MNFAAPHFADPRWLLLAVLCPLTLIALQLYAMRARQQQLAKIASPDFLVNLTQSHSPARRVLKDILLVLGFAGMGVALARPQWGELELAGEELGEDIVFAVDCSRSMLAADVSPNRLERAKLAVSDYTRRHARGRIGLVAFAGQAFLQCPLTFDHGAFEDSLRALDDKTIPVQGTDIGRALDESYRAMEKMDRRKVIVLLTDGEDLEKSGAGMAAKLAREGVVVFTIGVGTVAGAEIRALNDQGQVDIVRDRKGETVRSRLDEPALLAIARATKGNYFPLGPVGEGLAKVRLAVDSTGVAGSNQPARKLGVERFHYPLAIALALLVGESLVGTRRFSRARRHLAGVFLFGLVAINADATANTTTNSVSQPEPAPVNARDFFNAGTRKLNSGDLRDAEPLLQTALAQQDERIRPDALYNLGLVRFKQGAEELKKSPDANRTKARSRNALSQGEQALTRVNDALEGNDLLQMLTAYQRGRGAKKELKAASEQLQRAMEIHGVTLRKWQRALGDFQGAAELNPADTNAQHNARTTERAIAKLVDSLREMQQLGQAMGEMTKELGAKLKQLRGMIPDPLAPPGGAGEDEEDEERDQPNGPKEGQREERGREGEEKSISPEEAGMLLEGFKLGGDRRLPMGQGEQGKPKDRKGRDW
ncbi:MAG: VWA domain-containing protein [Verrucomicrobia bacterium]|nr:VWA domain-containing protein [Verrucomicrobiota bacterium]